MKKQIAILELYQHDEVVRHYCNLLQDSEYNIKIYCSKVVYEGIKYSKSTLNMEFTLMEDGESIPTFLQRQTKNIVNSDLVLITTALSHFKSFLSLSKKVNIGLLIHNVHSYVQPNRFIQINGLKDFLRKIKTVISKDNSAKRNLISNSKFILFPTEKVKHYSIQLDPIFKSKHLIAAPFSSKELNLLNKKPDESIFTITIPGTVSEEVRNYDIIWDAFKKILNKTKTKVNLVLLGKSNSRQITDKSNVLKGANFNIEYFNDYLSSAEYDRYLFKSDLILLPIKKIGKNYIYKEKMGYSKISGSVNDAIRSNALTLIPEHYPIPFNWTEKFRTFNSENLSQLLFETIENNIDTNPASVVPQAAKLSIQKEQFLFELNKALDL